LRICIDITQIALKMRGRGGVYRYIYELVESLAKIDRKNDYTLFVNFFKSENMPVFNKLKKRLRVGDNFTIKLSRYPAKLRRVYDPPVELLAGRFDVFHNCFDYLPPILLGKGIASIHDIRYIDDIDYSIDDEWIETLRRIAPDPEFSIRDCRSRARLFESLGSHIKKTVSRSDAIIVFSEFTKGKLVDLLGVDEKSVTVIPHAPDRHFRPLKQEEIMPVLEKFHIKKPYIFYSGQFDPFKNLLRLVEAFSIVRASHDVCLVFTGPRNWFYYIVMEKARELGVADSVIATGVVTDGELASLYSGAAVFAFCSLYEGFGIPPLEAMSCGAPVVASAECSIPEVVGDAALLVDAYSSGDMARGLTECLDNRGLCEELGKKGLKRAKNFTWEKAAEKTLEVYQSV